MNRSLKAVAVTMALLVAISPAALAICNPLSFSITPSQVQRGGTVTLTTHVQNCSTHNELVTVRYSILYGSKSIFIGSATFPLSAGTGVTATRTFTIPTAAPTGTYTLRAAEFVGTTFVKSVSHTLTVTP
jgi:hypothetical protein